jgi:hypothetical protein
MQWVETPNVRSYSTIKHVQYRAYMYGNIPKGKVELEGTF